MNWLRCVLALVMWLAFSLMLPVHAQIVNPPLTKPVDARAINPLTTSATQYKIDVWQTEQGLPLNTVQAMYQSRTGYLWVGTAGGLARFDGIRFTTFESSAVPELVSARMDDPSNHRR